MKTFTITLSDEQLIVLNQLMVTRTTRSEQDVLEQVVERGLYTLNYRTERNKRVYAEQKEEREELKQLREMLRSRQ